MSQSRQLAAIMFTDIVGYTALMGEDEEAAFALLEKNRKLHQPLIEKYGGRLLKEIGDGILASFISTSDAVYCSIEILKKSEKQSDLSLRIGIHLGDVVFQNDDVFGDGVNIASRIESITPPGTIYISESVLRNIENKKDIFTKYVGQKTFKNLTHPIRIHQITISEYSGDGHNKPIREVVKKSIAVLSFANMSNDPEQEYFCDGIAEDIINTLAKIIGIQVVARTSAFSFKGQNKDMRGIGDELGVQYILEGSVRLVGSRLRITAQLIDVKNGFHLWSERFDRNHDDIFAIQDEISLAIVDNLKVNLLSKQKEALAERSTIDLETHKLNLLARYHWNKLTEIDAKIAQEYYEQIIEMNPNFSPAYSGLSMVYYVFSNGGVNVIPSHIAVPRIKSLAEKALKLDPVNSVAHQSLALNCIFNEHDWFGAYFHCKKALEISPSDPTSYQPYAYYLSAAGNFRKAIEAIEYAVKLDPVSPLMLVNAALHYYLAKQFDASMEYCEKCLAISPYFSWASITKGLLHIQYKEYNEAAKEFQHALKDNQNAYGYFGYTLGITNQKTEAKTILSKIQKGVNEGVESKFSLALVHFGLGKIPKCLEILEELKEENPALIPSSAWLSVDPIWDPIRDNIRFQKISEQMAVPDMGL